VSLGKAHFQAHHMRSLSWRIRIQRFSGALGLRWKKKIGIGTAQVSLK
jgi:hypothetical protein